MKKTIRLLSLLLAFCFICSLFTGCEQSADEELIARNNAIAASGFPFTTDETDGLYNIGNFISTCYIDTNNAISVPVCGKPECTHDDKETCFSVWSVSTGQEFYYYQNHLYYGVSFEKKLYQSDSVGNNQRAIADFDELMKEQVITFLDKDETLNSGEVLVDIGGIHDGKLYVLAQNQMEQLINSTMHSAGYTNVQALFTYDLKKGTVERCKDETLRSMIENTPLSNNLHISVCGDLLFIIRNTTEYERLPVPKDFFLQEDWMDVWVENDGFIKEIPGHMEYRAYNLKSKQVVKEWSVPIDPVAPFDSIRINEDQTFLYAEKSDGKVIYTEYNDACEKTAEFALDENTAVTKHGGVYYEVNGPGERVYEILRYDPKTGKTDALKVDGSFLPNSAYGFYGILNDQMLVRYISKAEHEFGLLDLSSFDTGEVKIRPVEGASRTNMGN